VHTDNTRKERKCQGHSKAITDVVIKNIT